jgi:DNA polymerase-1
MTHGRYPAIAPLRELRYALGKMRLNSLAVGQDGRNRTGLMPFGSKTSRNQPSNARFVFGTSRWLRSLIQPAPGRALAYVDWSSQEIAIAAALSGDAALWEAYTSGDPYMAFAKQAGLVPPEATKATHKAERQRAKTIVLGVGYGMSADSMAAQAGLHIDEARDLLLHHKYTYRRFWEWATQNQNAGLLGFTLQTTFGWTWRAGIGTQVNPRSLLNWPMQANGAEMMRLACCDLTERGIMVCCPVHDALLVEGPTDNIDSVIAATRAAMEHASELVLGEGYIVKTDVDIVRHPDRYADEAGVEMWDRVMARLEARGW